MADQKKGTHSGYENEETKNPGFGVRHIQMASTFLTLTSLFVARSSMGVAVLAMSDIERRNISSVSVYDWDKQTQSIILSSFFWGYVVMQIPAGILAKRFGGKLILLVSLLVNGCLCIMIPLFTDLGGWPFVCSARVVMGLSQSCLFPAIHTLIGQWYPPNERTSFTGIIYGGVQVGTIFAMPISGVLAETAMGWKLIFYTMAGLLFLTAAVWYWFSASYPSESRLISKRERQYIEFGLNSSSGAQKSMRTPWKEIMTSKSVYGILASNISSAVCFTLFFVDMPTYLEKGLHISLKDSASLSALPYIGMWLGSTCSSIIAEKLLNRNMLSVGACRKLFNSIAVVGVVCGLILLSFLGPSNRAVAIVALVTTLTMSGFYSAGFTVNGLDLSPNFAGVIFSITNGLANIIGGVLTPLLTSVILQNDSSSVGRWRIVFLITAGVAILGNLIYVALATSETQPWNEPDYFEKKKCDPEELIPIKKENNAVEKNDLIKD